MNRPIISPRFGFVGALAIAVSALVAYAPSMRVGFLGDDWWFLGKAVTLNLPDYLAFYFDPAQQIFWYRPLYGILLGIEYFFFRAAPEGYHAGQIILHLGNALLLFAIIWKLTRRWRVALIAALFYATVPVSSSAVFWVAVQDPLAVLFFLAAIWFWIDYLQSRRARAYIGALIAFILAVLSKETSILLPGILVLVNRWLVRDKATARELIARYSVFAVLLAALLVIEYRVQASAYFPNRWGYSLGAHVAINGARYFALLAFPWQLPEPLNYFWLAFVVAALIVVARRGHARAFLFLGAFAFAAILPALFFPTDFFYPRYLYAATIVSAILFALGVEALWFIAARYRMLIALGALGVIALNSAQTIQAGLIAAEEGRQMRVPLRDIYQDHPAFPADTFLYFVDFPYPYILRNLSGMISLRYGANVAVWSNDAEWGGVDENQFANLRAHTNSFVYYLAENQRREIFVQRDARLSTTTLFPLDSAARIRLEGFEATASELKRGDALALLLYWRARGQIENDYTVFVHLLNARDEIVLSDDAQPRGGRAPTSQWRAGKMIADAHILNLPRDLALGVYRLEIGMYYLPTLARVQFADEHGASVDHIVIESFRVSE
ncbi:MAG: glycosyltransferase family 39 protein [Chloroflexi bacterium]|nr:glycosyltransferase family 39 protein [Chloroflexota bacterium]